MVEQFVAMKRLSKVGMTFNSNDFDPYTQNILTFIANEWQKESGLQDGIES